MASSGIYWDIEAQLPFQSDQNIQFQIKVTPAEVDGLLAQIRRDDLFLELR